ncbi:MAG: L,D-transpeptidase [Acidimicrobiales bacterium]
MTRGFSAFILLALFAGACGGSDIGNDEIGVALSIGAESALTSTSTSTTVAPATSTSVAEAPTTTLPPDPHRTWVATALPHVDNLEAFTAPDGRLLTLPWPVSNPHQFGGPLTLMVTEGVPGDDWVRVQLPIRPNGQEGWIDMSDYELSNTRVRAEVVLSETAVRVFDGDEMIAESQAVVGALDTPTPLGTFYIAAKKQNTEEEYFLGSWAMILSSFSEALPSFSGGLPVIAIHGTHRPDDVGEAITFGCVRVPNDVIDFLAENVPLGAPVEVAV